jgi:hypothetical protein
MTDLFVGATAGLSSSASIENPPDRGTGQASPAWRDTQTIILLCHVPTKRTELVRTDVAFL